MIDDSTTTDTEDEDLDSTSGTEHRGGDDEGSNGQSAFPVEDLSKIVEVQGRREKLTPSRRRWRQWLRERCKDDLQQHVLASRQKQNVEDLVKFINESPKSSWKGMVGKTEQITTTWLRREVTSCHNKYYTIHVFCWLFQIDCN